MLKYPRIGVRPTVTKGDSDESKRAERKPKNHSRRDVGQLFQHHYKYIARRPVLLSSLPRRSPLARPPCCASRTPFFFLLTLTTDTSVPFLIPFQTGPISPTVQTDRYLRSRFSRSIIFHNKSPTTAAPQRLSVTIPTKPYPRFTMTRTIPFAHTPLSLVLRPAPTRTAATSLRKSQVAPSQRSSPLLHRILCDTDAFLSSSSDSPSLFSSNPAAPSCIVH